MTAYEIISIFLGILGLLISFGGLIVATISFLDKKEQKSPPPVKRVARDAGSKPALLGCASRRWLSLSCYGKFAAHPSHSSVQATLLLTRRCP